MKKITLRAIFSFFIFFQLIAINSSFAYSNLSIIASITKSLDQEAPLNWKVGDYVVHELSTLIFFRSKTREEVTEETDQGYWARTVQELPDGDITTTDRLYQKSDGKVIKKIVDGEEKPVEEDNVQTKVLEEEERDVTVKAGSFQATYRLIKIFDQGNEEDSLEMKIWVNKEDTALTGVLKMTLAEGLIASSEMIDFEKK